MSVIGAPAGAVLVVGPVMTGWLSTTNVASLPAGSSDVSHVSVVVCVALAALEIRAERSGPESDPGEVSVLPETLTVSGVPVVPDPVEGPLMIGPF
jgi:hypothetical protein